MINSQNRLDRTFHISLLLKAADSVLEIIGGLFALIVSPSSLNHWAATITQYELSKDPHDFWATHILRATHDFAGSGRFFAAFYLLSHGIVKIVLIIALFKEKLWAYPAMIAVLGGFIVYQLYRISNKFSISLTLLTLFDMFIVWLTLKEYKRHRPTPDPQKHPTPTTDPR